ncbi:hypothetical protein LTR09_001610 [Extremus antarcticus]|uniref:Uncharacterized protein n=1 Tax=Extremus antarcticus TaxID=702011 RepID=A0AAJ0GH30_9PEZI|nr:hypothetical protein LTR09_001610 [Extremus antarcticus]
MELSRTGWPLPTGARAAEAVASFIAQLEQTDPKDHVELISAYEEQLACLDEDLDGFRNAWVLQVGDHLEQNIKAAEWRASQRLTFAQWLDRDALRPFKHAYTKERSTVDQRKPKLERIERAWKGAVASEGWIAASGNTSLEALGKLADSGHSLAEVKQALNAIVYWRVFTQYQSSRKHTQSMNYQYMSLTPTHRDYLSFFVPGEPKRRNWKLNDTLSEAVSSTTLRTGVPGRPMRVAANGLLEDDDSAQQPDISRHAAPLTPPWSRPSSVSAQLPQPASTLTRLRRRDSATPVGNDGTTAKRQKIEEALRLNLESSRQGRGPSTAVNPMRPILPANVPPMGYYRAWPETAFEHQAAQHSETELAARIAEFFNFENDDRLVDDNTSSVTTMVQGEELQNHFLFPFVPPSPDPSSTASSSNLHATAQRLIELRAASTPARQPTDEPDDGAPNSLRTFFARNRSMFVRLAELDDAAQLPQAQPIMAYLHAAASAPASDGGLEHMGALRFADAIWFGITAAGES